jgi:NhaA family Na+:H+ antiporter
LSLKLFLLTLAVADDLGAIAVIAIFYSHGFNLAWLLAAVGLLGVVYLLRRRRVWYVPLYVVVGVVIWYCMLKSGIHATVAGVALGFLTPTDPLRPDLDRELIADQLENQSELSAADVQAASFLIKESVPVGERLVDRLHPWTSFVIVPVFALVNAGIPLTSEALRSAASSTVTWGVGAGLVIGKTVGVFVFAWLAIRFGIAKRPRGASNLHIVGIAMAAGIGFTVALFVTGLAFDQPGYTDEAKVGILAASAVAALGSAFILRLAASRTSSSELELEEHENEEFFQEEPSKLIPTD